MEQHPVPQNVTTFQFRLIGDMTIKQFGYLAGGAILAFISYKLPLPFFFSWPLTIIFALGGVGFAFVPIEERPMDVWVLSFLKNVYSPTLYVWEKSPVMHPPAPTRPPPATQQQQRLVPPPVQPVYKASTAQPMQQQARVVQQPNQQAFAPKTTASVVNTMYAPKQQHQSGMFDWLFSFLSPKPAPVRTSPAYPTQAPHMATPSIVGAHLDISMPPSVAKNAPAQKLIVEQEKQVSIRSDILQQQKEIDSSKHDAHITDLQKQLADALAQKSQMNKDFQQAQGQARTSVSTPLIHTQAQQPKPAPVPAYPIKQDAPATTAQKQPTVKIITPEGAVRAGLPRLTTFPNVVTGITKDSDNNFLPGVLVTVKDKDGIPVRALKTNRLGQFAASTPLSNGVYFVEIEDPRQRYTFDRVQITLNGSIVPALEIITKSQKQITRDKLTKELFGNTT